MLQGPQCLWDVYVCTHIFTNENLIRCTGERGGYMFWKPLLTDYTMWLNLPSRQSRNIVRNDLKENQHESHIAFVVVWDAGIREHKGSCLRIAQHE